MILKNKLKKAKGSDLLVKKRYKIKRKSIEISILVIRNVITQNGKNTTFQIRGNHL